MSHPLSPQSRVLFNDALRPPAGYGLDAAVGTTYTLNLTALLLAPMSFALADDVDTSDLTRVDPVRLLEAVRRHADVTTVFCQAGGIAIPGQYRSILAFIEDSVREVMPPQGRGIFHPKIWALRFTNRQNTEHRHRLVIASRNLTFDRSWDTALILDQTDGADERTHGIDAAPAASFIRALPALATRTLPQARRNQINSLAESLEGVRLAPPPPFDSGELLPIGLDGTSIWPFPSQANRILAISPFLTSHAVETVGAVSRDATLLSRAESLDMLGTRGTRGWSAHVLLNQTDTEAGTGEDEDQGHDEVAPAATEVSPPGQGLHAKTYVLDLPGSRTMLVTGSANLTSAPWGGGVEFGAVLHGPTRACGVRTLLDGVATAPGLGSLIEPYAPMSDDGVVDPSIEVSREVENLHRVLAAARPRLHIAVSEGDDNDRVTATLTFDLSDTNLASASRLGTTRVWIASLGRDAAAQPLAANLTWTLAAVHVTPFIAVETTTGSGDTLTTHPCALMAELTGADDNRRHDAAAAILTDRNAVLRYLMFALGDGSPELAGGSTMGGASSFGDADDERFALDEVALLEPMVRAIGRDDDALARVAGVLEDLRATPAGAELLSAGLGDLWDAVWAVHQEGHIARPSASAAGSAR